MRPALSGAEPRRADFYRDVAFLRGRVPPGHAGKVYPASTGIGALGRGVVLSAVALGGDRDDLVVVPLENPRQTSAYCYCATYGPESPKFARAMAVSWGVRGLIFISGTASITHSETQHAGDALAQTRETLANIAVLISEENLSNHGLRGLGTSLEGLALARVYLRRQADYAGVRAICEKQLAGVPATYVVADVCRDDLLVEIEGIAFSAK